MHTQATHPFHSIPFQPHQTPACAATDPARRRWIPLPRGCPPGGGSQRPSGARISARYDLADGADVAFADVRSLLTTLMRTSATHAEFEAVVRPAFNLTECVCAYLSHPHGKVELE